VRALNRLTALQEEQRRLEEFIATYRSLSTCVDQEAGRGNVVSADVPTAAPVGPMGRRPHSTEEIVTAAMEILSKNKAPMKLGALYDALVASNIVIGGKIPRNNLGAKLSADSRLVTIKGHGWWFADEALPPWILDEASYPRAEGPGHESEGPEAFAPRPSHLNGAAGDTA
jgi:hypothetical protein